MAGKSVLSDEEVEEDPVHPVHREYEDADEDVDNVDEVEQDAEEEDNRNGDEERQRKKNRKKRELENYLVLDEKDYELIGDSDASFRSPKVESKKFMRLKKARIDVDEGPSRFYDRTGNGSPLEDNTGEDRYKDEMDDFIADEEEIELDELLRQRELVLEDDNYERRVERRLEDEFEQSILSKKCMTDNDDRIRERDIPERMQVSDEILTDGMRIREESSWILNQIGRGMVPFFSKQLHELAILPGDIVRFLEFLHVQKLDVPFIAMYRKEECRSLLNDPDSQPDTSNLGNPDKKPQLRWQKLIDLLNDPDSQPDTSNLSNPDKKPQLRWHKVLWAILELDRKWLLLQKRKTALQSYFNKLFEEEGREYVETRLYMKQKLFDLISKSLNVAESELEINDVESKYNLHFPPGDIGEDEGQLKGPKRESQYSICSKAGLGEVASKFGYSSEEFGLLISLEQSRVDDLENSKETPEEVASRFTCAMFENPQVVLRGSRHMAANEISCEPSVRRHVRSIFMDNAVVSTNPTADGNVSIDSSHQFAGIKWLKDKPLTRFNDAQWLLIQKAEEENLLKVSVKLPESLHVQLIKDAHDIYLSDGVCKSARLWNEQRKLIIRDAFDGLLLPSMAKEARALLTSRAKKWLVLEYGKLLWDKVSVAPYQKNYSEDYEAAPRVMACCWGPRDPAITFVMLDSYGEVLDVLYAGSIIIRGQSFHNQKRKKSDEQRVIKFMTDYLPNVVVIGAVSLSCSLLKENIYEIIFKMIEDNPRDVGHEMDNIHIVYADETLPHLYENSRISSDQLQPQSGIVKRAVALGRYLQNPLAMVATLCGPAKEILSWKLSPLESFLTPDEKYNMVEQIMVDATNQVGLDVNLAISHEWLFAPLQFISGLGPRKAASLQQSLVRASSIYNRKDLLTHGLGKKVFVNAEGFLRVRRSGNAASSRQFIDLLDDTRIHPESYGLAQELAKYMYTADERDDVNDEDMLEMAMEHVRENRTLLKILDVDEYAKSMKHIENKKETLNHIRLELIQGFQDWRKPYMEPNKDEEFYMLSGETPDTLSEGKIVQATVRRVQPRRAVCVLDSGLIGMLSNKDYSDDLSRATDLTERLSEGDTVTCKIKSIQKRRFLVFLCCRESDLRSDRSQSY